MATKPLPGKRELERRSVTHLCMCDRSKGTPITWYMPLYQWRHEHLLEPEQRSKLFRWTSGFVKLASREAFRVSSEDSTMYNENHADRVLFFYDMCKAWWHMNPAALCKRYKKSFYEAEAWLHLKRLGIALPGGIEQYRSKEIVFFVKYFSWRRSGLPYTEYHWQRYGHWPNERCQKLFAIRSQRLQQLIDTNPGFCPTYGFKHNIVDIYTLENGDEDFDTDSISWR